MQRHIFIRCMCKPTSFLIIHGEPKKQTHVKKSITFFVSQVLALCFHRSFAPYMPFTNLKWFWERFYAGNVMAIIIEINRLRKTGFLYKLLVWSLDPQTLLKQWIQWFKITLWICTNICNANSIKMHTPSFGPTSHLKLSANI